MEYSTDLQRVVRATPLGRKKLFAKKIAISSALSAAVSLAVLLPRLWRVEPVMAFRRLPHRFTA